MIPLIRLACWRLAAGVCFCWWALLLGTALQPALAFDPTDRYEPRQVEGWTVRVHKQLLEEQPALADATLKLLGVQLYQIGRVVPSNAVARLREVPIWVELAHLRHPCMCYHPSADWLREHDMNPAKAGSVEIANATNFLTWTRQQPWMVLHELAHAYHHQVLKHGHPELKAAYERAVAGGAYEKVLHIDGRSRRHYALNNDEEYFAEASEAFFGVNDFYPFVRAELQQHDPLLFDLLKKLWGTQPPAGERAGPVRSVGEAEAGTSRSQM